MTTRPRAGGAVLVALVAGLAWVPVATTEEPAPPGLAERVRAFLEGQQWRDMNVPARDGRFLHDLIVERGYTRALEIGTSTGHSGIWIALALSRTGGRLVTLEIDAGRHAQALRNFEEAGVARYVDARLGDAHELVRTLEGPFDFVFSDADKGWYTQYFVDLAPKLAPGGCYVTHNIGMRSVRGYVDYLEGLSDFETVIENERTSGVAVTCRRD